MEGKAFRDTWLGTAITLHVALSFMYLSALAIAHRALAPAADRFPCR